MGIVLLVIAAIVIVLLFRFLDAKRINGSSPETPLEILKTRYAKGEVTKEEFDRMKKDLL